MKIDVDLRLANVSFELHSLKHHLQVIEEQITYLSKSEHSELDKLIQKENLSPEDPDWHQAVEEYHERIDFLLPRFFRGPFLVVLYSVYESTVTEIARLIQSTKGQAVSLDDLRGDFLERAKKYYINILEFELYKNNGTWERIKMLAGLRHALVHTNGRIEILNKGGKKKIKNWVKQNCGISSYHGYLVVDAIFTSATFNIVRLSIEQLVKRYKDWDSTRRNGNLS